MSTEAFIKQAAHDPRVPGYKTDPLPDVRGQPRRNCVDTSGERGKQVAALVEVKARGDEAANIGWARALEQAGVHVVYGLIGLKTHAKTALVVRKKATASGATAT